MLTRLGARCFSTEALKVVNNVAKQQFQVTMGDCEYTNCTRNINFVCSSIPCVFNIIFELKSDKNC